MGRVVLVTGAGRGLGAATAERLAQDGWDVVVNYRHTAEGAESVRTTVEAMGQRALVAKADVSRWDEVKAMVAQTIEELGSLDAVVNNAGVYRRATLDALEPEDWHETLDINLTGTYYVTKAALPHLREGARVVNLASVLGASGSRHGAHYAASKGGVIALTKSLAKELGPKGILVNCIAPGAIDTDMIGQDTAEQRGAREKTIPLGRVGAPHEISGVVSFLLGPDASYLTGQVLHVNGGLYV
ncbi:MAG: 3-oxoacyl-[acyl-carrier protein] reductase [Thermoplasmata archaeon]|jgi:3-oxoacyl-[acyl-carrier protein] reductase|nr:3-oxoacyl-[acyl-carrier protein] reductase [Thermoplasmata archaeon]